MAHAAPRPTWLFPAPACCVSKPPPSEADGRISMRDLGLYNDTNEFALQPVLDMIRAHSKIPDRRAALPRGTKGIGASAV